jgi:hypothetical protein
MINQVHQGVDLFQKDFLEKKRQKEKKAHERAAKKRNA